MRKKIFMRMQFSFLLKGVIMALMCVLMMTCNQTDRRYEEALSTPLTYEVKEPGSWLHVSVGLGKKAEEASLSFQINDGEIQPFVSGRDNNIFLKNVGDRVSFYGDHTIPRILTAGGEGSFYIYGNVMSLITPIDFANAKVLTGDDNFRHFFDRRQFNHETKDLVLPATTLTERCYEGMFQSTAITRAPKLPAMTLTESCYECMFANCEYLEEAPELPATTLAKGCYYHMFAGSGINELPQLPDTAISESFYGPMVSKW